MKKWDYEITLSNGQNTLIPRSERAKKHTPEPVTFQDKKQALEFVIEGARKGFLFSNRQFVDPEWKPVPCGWFLKKGDDLQPAGQDWCPPEPMYEPNDVHPSGPKDGKMAIIREVRTGNAAKEKGFAVVIVIEEVDAAAN